MELSATHHRASSASARRRQRGDIMLVTLVFVLMCLLGLVYSMRDTIVSNQMTGNNLVRQKDVQVADIALRIAEGKILSIYAGQPLEVSAVNQSWWRAVAAGATIPPGYWDTCAGSSATSTTRCDTFPVKVNNAAIPYTAYVVVQPGGRADTGSACTVSQFTAMYYDIFVHIKESNGATDANTEAIYRLCALT